MQRVNVYIRIYVHAYYLIMHHVQGCVFRKEEGYDLKPGSEGCSMVVTNGLVGFTVYGICTARGLYVLPIRGRKTADLY